MLFFSLKTVIWSLLYLNNCSKLENLNLKTNLTMDLTWTEFEKVEMRAGTVLEVNDYPEARKPAYQLTIDFGPTIGIRKTSAQITKRYQKEALINKQIVAVVNLPKKQIGKFMSECLVLGSVGDDNDIVLLQPDFVVDNGLRIG